MKELIKYTKGLLEKLERANLYAPFPVYDTEYVSLTKNNLDKMYDKKYDEGAVTACKFCNELSTVVDELENTVCTRCGSVNDTITYTDIYEFLKTKNEDS